MTSLMPPFPVLMPRRAADDLPPRRDGLDDATVTAARMIVEDIAANGARALAQCVERYDGRAADAPLTLDRAALQSAPDALDAADRAVLGRAAQRIADFAAAQRAALQPVDLAVSPAVRAGHTVVPVACAGAYAPGGRYPLPSSVLMTAITARVAGVETVWVASPNPGPVTLAAAAIAGADGVLCAGGAHAIAALAYGTVSPACDVVVGPGNRWVTAAKSVIAARCRIDMLAGPSELMIIADDTADPALAAADLLAQAEHDDDALPVLVLIADDSAADRWLAALDDALRAQLRDLPTAETARTALAAGGAIVVDSRDDAVAVADRFAPEHLQIVTRNADTLAARVRNAGALFIGAHAAEVLGDYGAGPNHTLPTGGTARAVSGLSVLDFVRTPTWIRAERPDDALLRDTAALARLEGLEAHARAAERRRDQPG